MFHLPVAAVAFGFSLGCGGFIFIELGLYKLIICWYMISQYVIIFGGDGEIDYYNLIIVRAYNSAIGAESKKFPCNYDSK